MPEGKDLLSGKDFALQIADKGFVFQQYQQTKKASVLESLYLMRSFLYM